MHERTDTHRSDEQRKRLLDSDPIKKPLDYPIEQYNYVLGCYNMIQSLGESRLRLMKESSVYRSFWKLTERPCLIFIVLLLVAVPVLGLGLYIWMFAGIMTYFSGLTVYTKNAKKVPDLFKQMVYCPELCMDEEVINKDFHMRVNELDELDLNQEVVRSLKAEQSDGFVRFIVYAGKFWEFYNNYPKYRTRHIFIAIISTIFLVAQAFIVYLIYHKVAK